MDHPPPDYKFDILVVQTPKQYESGVCLELYEFGQPTSLDHCRRHVIEGAEIELDFRRYFSNDASELLEDKIGMFDGFGMIFLYGENRSFDVIKRFSDDVKKRSQAWAESIVLGIYRYGDLFEHLTAARLASEHGLTYRKVSTDVPTTLEQALLELAKRLLVKAHEKRVGNMMTEVSVNMIRSCAGHFACDFGRLLASNELCDFTIKTSDESFRVHKAVLAARSPVFGAMFRSEWRECTEGAIKLEFVEAETIKKFIEFLYTDKLEFDTKSVECYASCLFSSSLKLDDGGIKLRANLIELADQYELPRLKELSVLQLNSAIDLESGLEILKIGDLYEIESLKQDALAYIKRHKKELNVDHLDVTLTQLSPSTRKEILAALVDEQKTIS